MGSRADGRISRFSGPYTLFPALVSGLAAVVVGDPDGYAEISPLDEVADAIAAAALGPAPRLAAHRDHRRGRGQPAPEHPHRDHLRHHQRLPG
ncbi:hypothetical protein GCM10020000_02880 [Streptomyces olivoverticillatus]